MRRSLALSLLLGLTLAAAALAVSEPRLVADLATELPLGAGSFPHGFTDLDGHVVFAARPDDHADRFYRTDGTATGTSLLAAPCAPLESGWISLLHAGASRAFYGVSCDGGATALWTSDGRASGTIPLLPAGAYQYASPFYPAPGWVEAEGQTYFFQGGNYAAPLELWKTDGTAAGTVRLAVLTDQNGATGALARMGDGELLLLVWEHFASLTVWRSDGTVGGTAVATAIDLGGLSFSVRSFAATGDAIYFMVEGGAPHVKQLWSSDGTSAATLRLAEFDTGIWDDLVAREGAIYFAAEADGNGGIWRSDGTAATTRRIAALDGLDISPASFAFLGDRIYWLGFAEDWSAGSLYGAPIAGGDPEELLQSCDGGFCTPLYENLWLYTIGDSLVFARRQPGAAAVWRSGGFAGDAERLAPLCDAPDCSYGGYGSVVLGDRLFFVNRGRGTITEELWISDGTAAGTLRLAGPQTAIPLGAPSDRSPIASLPGAAGWLFAAGDLEHGIELWHARAVQDSGARVADLRLDRPGLEGLEPIGTVDSTLVFAVANPDFTRTLYRHQYGEAGVAPFLTVPMLRGRYGSRNPPPSLRPAGSAWYLFESDFDGDQSSEEFAQQIWRYDPRSGQTQPLFAAPTVTGVGALAHDLFPSREGYVLLGSRDLELQASIYLLQPETGVLSRLADFSSSRVWSVGRSGGTWFLIEDWSRIVAFDLERRTFDVVADFPGAGIYALDTLPFGLLFQVERTPPAGDGERALWQSDGTAGGTREIARWPRPAGGCTMVGIPDRSAISPAIFAVQTSCDGSSELWISDGSAARTRRLRIFVDDVPLVASGGVAFRGERYFLTRSLDDLTAFPVHWLWKTDGTPHGTVPVVALPAVSDLGFPLSLQGAAGASGIYFPWLDAEHGFELWRTDGTAEGTGLWADLEPGPSGSSQFQLWSAGDQVLFTAWTGAAGTELWQVDGGVEAPQLVADLYPGPESSSPWVFAVADGRVHFLADDGLVGREIWEVGEPSVAPCVPSPTTLCLLDGRFRVRAMWRDFAGRMGEAEVVPLTGDSGYLWFFSPGNPEVLLKVVDACGLPGFENFWAYSTGLTNVEVELEIVDTWSGQRKRVRTALGETFGPVFDSGSFEVCESAGAVAPPRPAAANSAGTTVLPLLGGRFTATVAWETRDGRSGEGQAVAIADDSGYFWFFAPSIVEVLVKMVDACGYPGFDNYWVFAGGLTDVAVRLTVHDTWSGATVSYLNLQGAPFSPLLETGALRVCGAAPP